MGLGAPSYLAAGGAALAAGVVNALAGGGTLISFPTLVGLGVPPVNANVTNTVALVPGYLAATGAQRSDLLPQLPTARSLSVAAAAGGLGGSVLLVLTPERTFRAVVPYLLLLSCLLLVAQDKVRAWVESRSAGAPRGRTQWGPVSGPLGESPAEEPKSTEHEAPGQKAGLMLAVLASAVYGGFFGAGLGIMLLAVLGVFTDETLVRSNAVKQILSFVINFVAAVFFVFSGHVTWQLVPIMAVASLVGGHLGGRLVRVINAAALRVIVVTVGVAVAITFWVG